MANIRLASNPNGFCGCDGNDRDQTHSGRLCCPHDVFEHIVRAAIQESLRIETLRAKSPKRRNHAGPISIGGLGLGIRPADAIDCGQQHRMRRQRARATRATQKRLSSLQPTREHQADRTPRWWLQSCSTPARATRCLRRSRDRSDRRDARLAVGTRLRPPGSCFCSSG